jgi:hypothetical protein
MESETNLPQSFIDSARRMFKPRMDYRVLPTPVLILETAKQWATALEIIVRIIDFPELEQELALRGARTIAARANEPKCLDLLYNRMGRLEPLAFLLFRLFEAKHILAELLRRLVAPLRIGTVLAAVSAPDGGGCEYNKAFLKALNVDRLRDFGGRDDPRDLMRDGVVGVLEKVSEIRERFRKAFPKALAFIVTPELSYLPVCRRWDWPEFYHEKMARVCAGLGVYFHRDVDLLSGAAFGAYNDVFRERDALKRGGPGRKEKETPDTDLTDHTNEPKSNGDQGPARQRVRHQEFDDEECASTSATPESAVRVQEIIRIAKDNLGPRAEKYFQAFVANATKTEAAEAAGVSDSMGRRYLVKLSQVLGRRPHKKV